MANSTLLVVIILILLLITLGFTKAAPIATVQMSDIPMLVSGSLKSFRDLEHIAETLSPDTLISAQSYLSMFKLWAGSLGAHHQHGHRSLEYRLSAAPRIRSYVVDSLHELCNLLKEGDWEASFVFPDD